MELLLASENSDHHLFAIEEAAILRWLDRGMESASILRRAAAFQPIEPRAIQTMTGLEDTHWKLTHLGDVPVALKARQAVPNLILKSLDHSVTMCQ
jgi:hypothetical protein